MRTVDLLFFMGQSNMAGRGDAALAPVVAPGMGYEYRVVTDPDTLHPLEEPFGVNENDPAGVYEPGMKTGAMVSSFVNAWTAQTGVPVVGVSCAKGGSAIAKWLPGTPYYQDAVRRARKARTFLADKRLYHPPQRDGLVPGLHRRRPAHPQGRLQSRHRARSAQLYAGRRRANLLFDPNRQPAR